MSSLHLFARPFRVVVRAVVLALVAATLTIGFGGTAAQAAPKTPKAAPTEQRERTQPILGIEGGADPSGMISGLVYDQDGNLLDNIEVEAFSSTDPGGEPVASDLTYEYENTASHGAYELHVPPGDYLVRFSTPDFENRRVFETAFYGGDAGTPVTVADGAQVALDDVTLARDTGAPVTGVVLDAAGHPVADAEVDLVRVYSAAEDDYSYVDSTSTDETGHYTIDGVNRGRAYTVRASTWSESGWSPYMFLGQQVLVSQASTFTLPAGSTGRALDPITLPNGTQITGHVTGPTGQPLDEGEIYVFATSGGGDLSYVGSSSEINPDGSFSLLAAPGFTYTVAFASWMGEEVTYLGDTHDGDTAQTFALGTDAHDVGTIHVGTTGSRVSVTVVDASGDPTNDADVTVWRKSATGFHKVAYLYGADDGTYTRRLDWGSQYTFGAQPYDSDTTYFLGGGTDLATAQTVTPTQAQPTLDAGTITVPITTRGRFHGVVSAEGAPLPGADVRLLGHTPGCDASSSDCWDWVTGAATRADGSYTLHVSDWMRGDYDSFTVAADMTDGGYGTSYAGGSSDLAGATTYDAPASGETTTVDLTLTPNPGQARGRYSLAGGASITGEADATLYCWNADGGYWDDVSSTWTESSRYSLSTGANYDACLVDMTYYGHDGTWRGGSVDGAWPTGDAVATTPGVFAVTADGITEVPDITLKAPSQLSGTLTSASDTPLHGTFEVNLYRWTEWGWDSWDYTESDTPAYSFDSLGAGTYAVRATYYPADGSDSISTWSGNGGRPSGPDAPGTATVGTEGGEVVHLDVAIGLQPVIHGTVVDGDGPVAGASVTLLGTYCDGCWPDPLATATTAADGSYDIPVEDYWSSWGYDRFTVSAEKPDAGYLTTWLGDTTDPSAATTVLLSAAQEPVAPITLAVQPGTLVVRTTTEDGGSLADSSSSFSIYRWNDEWGGLEYLRDGWAEDGSSFAVSGLDAGSYAIVVTNTMDSGDNRYLTTWYGGAEPHTATDPGLITVGTDNPTVATIQLRRGSGLSGTVTAGDTGIPVEGAWVSISGQSETDGSVWTSASTDGEGHYAVRLPSDTVVTSVSTSRDLFMPSNEGDGTTPLISLAGSDQTHDVSLTPDWESTSIGAVAGERDATCVSRTDSWEDSIAFGGRDLQITGTGIFTDWSDRVLDGSNSSAALVPMAPGPEWTNPTWGISGGKLCAQWATTGGATYQVWMTPTGDGEYDVTYNYDAIPSSPSNARAGWSDGQRSFGERVVLPGAGEGYADAAPTGLVNNSLGSEKLGRYAFHFTGFAAQGEAPQTWGTRIAGKHAVGATLSPRMRDWWIGDSEDPVPASDLTFHYRWHRGTTTLGSDPTYVAQPSDFGHTVVLDVDALVAGHRVGHTSARMVVRIGDAAATNAERPAITPESPEPGALLEVSTGTWTPRDGLTEGDLTYTYRWFRNGHRISGADASTYQLTDRDAGKQISADVTAAAAPYLSVTATAPAIAAPQLPQLTATTPPSITGGEPKVGETLEVDPGEWDVDGATLSYQWYVGWRQRATGTSYTLTSSDVGEYVTVVVTAKAPSHLDGSDSAVVGPVVRADAQTRALTVHVVDDVDGSPVSGAWVYACEDEEWTCLPAGATNASGSYSATGLAGREYSVSVYPNEPYRSGYSSISDDGDGSTTVRLTKPTPPPANVEIPTSNGTIDGMPVVYWQQDQDFNVSGCATTANPTYTVTFSDGTPQRTGALTKQGAESGGIATFHATIPAFYPSHGEITITTNVPADCGSDTKPTKISVYIDPSGTVTDQYGRGISGATVTLLRADAAGGPYVAVPNGSTIMSEANRANPSLTDSTGFFRWDVSAGWYRVKAEAPGCTQATTDAMQVPPPRVDLLVKLQCAGATAPTATPAISGTPASGSSVSTDTSIWDDVLDQVSVQWLRDGVAIDGATSPTYQVTNADRGHELTVRQTAQRTSYTQEEGRGAPVTFAATSATSAVTTVVGNLPAPTTTAPDLTGGATHRVGDTLGFAAPTWSLPGVTTTQEWYVDGAPTGVTTATFPLTAERAGHDVFVRLTGHLAGHDDGTIDSPTVTVAPGLAPTASVAPKITGTPRIGQTLTASPGTWSATGLTFGYQWQRAGSAIAGATGATYKPTGLDIGKAITVAVTATRAGYADGSATSGAVTIAKRVSTVVLTAPKSVKAGKKATFIARVSVPGLAGPTGTVTLMDGKKAIGSVTLAASAKGTATFVVKKLKAGKHQLTAVYSGSADTAGATSKAVTTKVAKPKKKSKKGRIMLQRTALARMQQLV